MRCSRCGNEVSGNDAFCSECGQPLHSTQPEPNARTEYDEGSGYDVRTEHDERSGHGSQKKKSKWIVPAIAAFAVIAALCAASAYIMHTKDKEVPLPTESPTESPIKSPTEEPVNMAESHTKEPATAIPATAIPVDTDPVFRLGRFSSEHRSSSDGVSSDTYYARHIADGDPSTAWIPVCEDDGLTPIGHWVEFTADTPQYVGGLKVINGFGKDKRKYFNNYRVKDIKIIINDTEEIYKQLHDLGCGVEEDIRLGAVYQADKIKIVIESVYETNPTYKEAAMSEITPVR